MMPSLNPVSDSSAFPRFKISETVPSTDLKVYETPTVVVVIDVGTNGLRTLVYEVAFKREGSGIALNEIVKVSGGDFSPEKEFRTNTDSEAYEVGVTCGRLLREQLLTALVQYRALRGIDVEDIRVVGTSALRTAPYCEEIVKGVRSELRKELAVVSDIGEGETAIDCYRACYPHLLSDENSQRVALIEIGGGSIQVQVCAAGGNVTDADERNGRTFEAGGSNLLRILLREWSGNENPLKSLPDDFIRRARQWLNQPSQSTWTELFSFVKGIANPGDECDHVVVGGGLAQSFSGPLKGITQRHPNDRSLKIVTLSDLTSLLDSFEGKTTDEVCQALDMESDTENQKKKAESRVIQLLLLEKFLKTFESHKVVVSPVAFRAGVALQAANEVRDSKKANLNAPFAPLLRQIERAFSRNILYEGDGLF
jgi:exopolyphosphatase/pppGpp-phosphohydrolase